MPTTTYGINPMLQKLFPAKASSSWAKPKGDGVETFPIGDDLVGFESLLPGQAGVSESLQASLLAALGGQFPEEYFSTAIADPMRRTFEQETLPGIKEAFVGPGTYWGTARAGAEVKGRERMEEDVAGKRAELAYQTQLQALQAALAYLGLDLMAAYQPYEEGEGGAAGGGWGSAILRALSPPKPKPIAGPVAGGGTIIPYAGPTPTL